MSETDLQTMMDAYFSSGGKLTIIDPNQYQGKRKEGKYVPASEDAMGLKDYDVNIEKINTEGDYDTMEFFRARSNGHARPLGKRLSRA